MSDVHDKLGYFQAITGLDDPDLCTEILQAHNWDLELAINSITSPSTYNPNDVADVPSSSSVETIYESSSPRTGTSVAGSAAQAAPRLAWRIVTLPFSIISGGLGLISGAVGLGVWVAGGILSYSFGFLARGGDQSSAIPPSAREATDFVSDFNGEYGPTRPNFVPEGFIDALQRSRREFKLLFVYLHSPDHPDTYGFCRDTLCSEILSSFINENFVSWGGSIRFSEGFKMSNSLKASRFPFCAVVMPASNQRIALIEQMEGPISPEEMLRVLQKVLEENGVVLSSARAEAEERTRALRLREEQDAAYRAALEADQAREREEQRRIEEERKRKEEEEAKEREAADKKAALVKLRQEKAQSLGTQPEKGPDVTQVLIRFPNGERRERRFSNTSTVQTVYDYVDSLDCFESENYNLVSNFPRTVYDGEKRMMSLKEAGLHPQASLFLEVI